MEYQPHNVKSEIRAVQRTGRTRDPDSEEHPSQTMMKLAPIHTLHCCSIATHLLPVASVVISRPCSRDSSGLEFILPRSRSRDLMVKVLVSVSRPDGQGLGLGLETWRPRSRSWSRDLKKVLTTTLPVSTIVQHRCSSVVRCERSYPYSIQASDTGGRVVTRLLVSDNNNNNNNNKTSATA